MPGPFAPVSLPSYMVYGINSRPDVSFQCVLTSGLLRFACASLRQVRVQVPKQTLSGGQTTHPLVSVVILNYNGNQFLETCLREVLRSDYPNTEVIVVDNGSSDGSVQSAMQRHSDDHRIKFLLNKTNLGFAEGNNVGAMSARGEFVIFLNNDTKTTKNWISELVSVAQSDRRVGIVICRILTESDPYGNLIGNVDRFGGGVLVRLDEKELSETIAAGPAFLISREAWDKVGGYDAKYFMYEEDIDLAWRIKLAGYKVVPARNSKVFHSVGGTARKSRLDVKRYFVYRNTLRTLIKNYSGISLPKTIPVLIVLNSIQSIALAHASRNPSIALSPIKAIFWNLRNLGDTWSLHRQIQKSRLIPDHDIERLMTHDNPIVNQIRAQVNRKRKARN